jgi:hypothetical protein
VKVVCWRSPRSECISCEYALCTLTSIIKTCPSDEARDS